MTAPVMAREATVKASALPVAVAERAGCGTPTRSARGPARPASGWRRCCRAAAAARAEGAITARQAEVIISAMARLRDAQLPVQRQADAEAFLVEQARRFDAATLAGIARRLLDTLDPDGWLATERSQQRSRRAHRRAAAARRLPRPC